MADDPRGRQEDIVLLVSDGAGNLVLLQPDSDGGDMFAAARRMMRSWKTPEDAPADRTRYVNAGLYEVPRHLLPNAEEMRQARDIRTLLSARKLSTIENDFRMYNLTECVHPAEPACAAAGTGDASHDWASDAGIDGGGALGGMKREHCRRPSCYAAKSAADRADRPDAYETDVPFVSYDTLDAAGRAAHDAAYGRKEVDKADKAYDDVFFGVAMTGFSTLVDDAGKAGGNDAKGDITKAEDDTGVPTP
ncbi:MAG: hypothetical protein OXK17_08380 [Thaumarchaeota archaeon]|nr:hypothetical protein [Nitrososphaerota archaeon]